MINPDENSFPSNVIALMSIALEAVDEDVKILGRPLRPSDPNLSIGIFGSLWMPDEDSFEIGHVAPHEPTLQSYQIGVQALVKDGDAERGLSTHSVMSKRVRSVLYRSPSLRVSLQSLYVSDDLETERLRRWGIRTQRYMNNDVEGNFIYLSTLDFWIETELS